MVLFIISILLYLLGFYLLIGIVFAVYFVFKGVTQLDAETKGSNLVFRLLIFPASVALWLPLWLKLRKAKPEPK
jgi:hypothetical protein